MTVHQPLKATTSWQCERYFRLHPFGYSNDGWRFSLHKRKSPNTFEYRLIGPDNRTQYLVGKIVVSDELNTLIVLMIGHCVPVGVVADKLQEEKPELEDLATKLREWEENEKYQDLLKPIMKESKDATDGSGLGTVGGYQN